jgi:hypothetical protein
VPTVVVGTDEFIELAHLEARNRGVPDLPIAVVKHPLGGIKPDEVERKADSIVDEVAHAVSVRDPGGSASGRG